MFANPCYVPRKFPCLPLMATRTLPFFCYSKWHIVISKLSSYISIPTAIDASARVISATGDNPWSAYIIIFFTTNFLSTLFENKLKSVSFVSLSRPSIFFIKLKLKSSHCKFVRWSKPWIFGIMLLSSCNFYNFSSPFKLSISMMFL